MASVPNLPIAPAVPTPGTPGTPDADGAAIDLFAQLLGGGPPIAVAVGPGATPVDVATLRAAPSGDDAESVEGEAVSGGAATPADIIPLLQAQSGFPVAVVPAAPASTEGGLTGPVPTEAAPADLQPPVRLPVAAMPARKPLMAHQNIGQPSVPSAPDAGQAINAKPLPPHVGQWNILEASDASQETGPEADIVGKAVEAAIGKFAGEPNARTGKPGRGAQVPSLEGRPVENVAASNQPRPVEPVSRIEAAVQPAAPLPTLSATPIAPQSATPVTAPAPTATAAPAIADLVVERQLDLASDNQWLDRLARDIARSGASDEPLRFRLHPQTLGHLQVELSQSDRGATVRLTVETEAARSILIDAQPRLAAEARAQGVRLAGTEVDLGTAHQQSGDPRRNADAQAQGVVRVVRASQADTNPSDPAAGRSDRYA